MGEDDRRRRIPRTDLLLVLGQNLLASFSLTLVMSVILAGFAKVLVDPESGRILGGHVIGPQAATLMQQIAQAMTFGLTAEQVAREQIWNHPGLPEVLENALLDALEAAGSGG